jgi:hypothetical protein
MCQVGQHFHFFSSNLKDLLMTAWLFFCSIFIFFSRGAPGAWAGDWRAGFFPNKKRNSRFSASVEVQRESDVVTH